MSRPEVEHPNCDRGVCTLLVPQLGDAFKAKLYTIANAGTHR